MPNGIITPVVTIAVSSNVKIFITDTLIRVIPNGDTLDFGVTFPHTGTHKWEVFEKITDLRGNGNMFVSLQLVKKSCLCSENPLA